MIKILEYDLRHILRQTMGTELADVARIYLRVVNHKPFLGSLISFY
jgi:hypothetical protein